MNEYDDDDDDEMPICDDVCCARCRFPLQQPMNIITLVFLKHWSLITHWDKDQKKKSIERCDRALHGHRYRADVRSQSASWHRH